MNITTHKGGWYTEGSVSPHRKGSISPHTGGSVSHHTHTEVNSTTHRGGGVNITSHRADRYQPRVPVQSVFLRPNTGLFLVPLCAIQQLVPMCDKKGFEQGDWKHNDKIPGSLAFLIFWVCWWMFVIFLYSVLPEFYCKGIMSSGYCGVTPWGNIAWMLEGCWDAVR